jgi:phage tail protein X
MATEIITVTRERTTLSALLARHYRRVYPGMVGLTYALNQDLAREGVFLPVGRTVTVLSAATIAAEPSGSATVTTLFRD